MGNRVDRRLRASSRTANRSWYQVRNRADTSAEVFIYDEIDSWFGVSAADFVRDLSALDVDAITVRINSPGGVVFDAIAILNALRAHPARITTVVDGLAASAASVIAMAGDEIVMRPNAEIMVHEAWGIEIGDAEDMRRMAERLDKDGDNIASIYAERAGGSVEQWREIMRAETWYSDGEAVAAGLADRVDASGSTETDDGATSFDLSIFTYAGRRAAPAPRALRSKATSAAEAGATQKEGAMPTLKDGLAERLGISADADDETALKALDEALAERAEETAADEEPEVSVDQLAPIAAKHGLALVDRAQYDATVAAAKEGQEARRQQLAEADARLVRNAVERGKIAPARAQHWLGALAADREGATAALNSLADGLIPVSEIGHSVDGDNAAPTAASVRDADVYKNWRN